MHQFYPPVREFIQQTLKEFPWSYRSQGDVMAAFADHLLTGRKKSWQSFVRTGIVEYSARQVQYSLLWGENHLRLLKERCVERFAIHDKREAVTIAVDDTSTKRYSTGVFGAAHQYNHGSGGIQLGNVIVDCWISAKSYLNYEYQLYLPKQFLAREIGHSDDLRTKIALASDMFKKQIDLLQRLGYRSDLIWGTTDSWYVCKELVTLFRESGTHFMMGIKSGAKYYHFGQLRRVDQGFAAAEMWHFMTNPTTQTKVYYQTKVVTFPTLGRCRLFAIKRGGSAEIKYYVTNKIDLTILSFCKRWKDHWGVETLHKNVKDFCGFDDCYSGREVINLSFLSLVYLLHFLFCQQQRLLQRQGHEVSLEQLWETYTLDADIERAQKCLRTTPQIAHARKRLVSGWC